MTYRISHYLACDDQRDICTDWLKSLRDRSAKIAIIRRTARAESGNLGDHKFCRDGVRELRIYVGAGYRVYYAQPAPDQILLLSGGTKPTQDRDIDQAVSYWQEWSRRPE